VGADIFSSSGTNLGSAPIPEIQSLQVVTSDSIYSPCTNTIISLATGATLWAGAVTACIPYNPANTACNINIGAGAITGSQVIFSSGALVFAQPY
jgi:hypothetical protein